MGAGMLGPMLSLGSKFGVGGIVVAVGLYFGGQYLMGGGGSAGLTGERPAPGTSRASDEAAEFVGFVLDDVQNTWRPKFQQLGKTYEPAKLVLFTDRTATGCGSGEAAMGPFYCPRDQRVFIDLGFFDELSRRFGAPGDFAQAYVIAHEIGHHVQHTLGLDAMKRAAGASSQGPTGASVRLELQADCFAGIWAHSTSQRQLLDTGDIEEGLAAASAVGDDRLQHQSTGTVNPETWSHGSAEQRSRWFRRGFTTGDFAACDTRQAEL